MPELPELEVIKNVLTPCILQLPIRSVEVRQPLVFRCLIDDLKTTFMGATFINVYRRGKFLLFTTNRQKILVINLMLTGRLQLVLQPTPINAATCLEITFENGHELRYFDSKQMGRIYLVSAGELRQIPQFADLGLDPLDSAFTLELFKRGLLKYWGMIKNVLTNQQFIAGIGNAYADEILFTARINPLKKSSRLMPDEVQRLYEAIKSVLAASIQTISQQIGTDIHQENRDFFMVHNRGGQTCKRCASRISELKPDGRITNFCRACQG